LEAAVRKSEKNRYLKSGLAKVDGLHLNKKGYRALDLIIVPTLEKIDWNMIYSSRIN
jgi:lysophospholipase L1-like esterase